MYVAEGSGNDLHLSRGWSGFVDVYSRRFGWLSASGWLSGPVQFTRHHPSLNATRQTLQPAAEAEVKGLMQPATDITSHCSQCSMHEAVLGQFGGKHMGGW